MKSIALVFLLNLLCINSIYAIESGVEPVQSAEINQKAVKDKLLSEVPFKQGSEVNPSKVFEVIIIFVVLIALTVLFLFLMKKHVLKLGNQDAVGASVIRVLASKRVSTRLTIFYIMVDDKKILFSESAGNVVVLNKENNADNNMDCCEVEDV